MPHYKVTYFNLYGLGEPVRLMLSYMGKEFEDNRIEMKDWPTLKSSIPFGKLPMLEIDDKKLHQSVAICRYLGKQCGLSGKDDLESLQIDMMVDTFTDFRIEVVKYMREKDEAEKEKLKGTLTKETIPYYMGKFDKEIKKNGGHIANTSLSWGDIYLASSVDSMNGILTMDVVEKYPNFRAMREKVFALPRIKAWVDKRPKCSF